VGFLDHFPSTKMAPSWGWGIIESFSFYQNGAPMGATKLSTLRGWVLDTLNFCYQNVDPTGLGA
jgi:hypothetical protein